MNEPDERVGQKEKKMRSGVEAWERSPRGRLEAAVKASSDAETALGVALGRKRFFSDPKHGSQEEFDTACADVHAAEKEACLAEVAVEAVRLELDWVNAERRAREQAERDARQAAAAACQAEWKVRQAAAVEKAAKKAVKKARQAGNRARRAEENRRMAHGGGAGTKQVVGGRA